MNPTLPRIVLTGGDPAGVGPDIILQIAVETLPAQLAVAGDINMFAARAKLHTQLGAPPIQIIEAQNGGEDIPPHRAGQLPVIHRPCAAAVVPGAPNINNANYTIGCVNYATDLCLQNKFDAMVTAPAHKASLMQAGIKQNGKLFCGHTEWIAARCAAAVSEKITPVMMLVGGDMRVCLATTHLPLAEVPAHITAVRLRQVIGVVMRDLRDRFGIAQPRLGVCGLNPHAGEDGHLGREEIEIIIPALDELRADGLDLIGPLPADTAFTPARLKNLDAILALYHDQGLPVIKHADFHNAVNVTLGLPIIRTSVDHGTAFALAGGRAADPSSLRAAIHRAAELAATKN